MTIADDIAAHRARTLALAKECGQQAAEHEHLAAELRAREKALLRQAAELDDAAAERDHLAGSGAHDYTRSVSAAGQPDVNMSRQKLSRQNRKHPFVQALHARGESLNAWAKRKGINYTTVRSWVDANPASGRRISLTRAKEIEAELGLPATEATWKNGIHRYDE